MNSKYDRLHKAVTLFLKEESDSSKENLKAVMSSIERHDDHNVGYDPSTQRALEFERLSSWLLKQFPDQIGKGNFHKGESVRKIIMRLLRPLSVDNVVCSNVIRTDKDGSTVTIEGTFPSTNQFTAQGDDLQEALEHLMYKIENEDLSGS
tara:strand:+ start:2358 stop:2807 length:450 start_codon:yes stop_codon:yes gene_type:complete